jgi:hypothetical protein
MKQIHQITFTIGIIVLFVGLYQWINAGFPIELKNISTMVFGTKPWNLSKDSYFFFIVLGSALAAYSAIELNLKRWDRGK